MKPKSWLCHHIRNVFIMNQMYLFCISNEPGKINESDVTSTSVPVISTTTVSLEKRRSESSVACRFISKASSIRTTYEAASHKKRKYFSKSKFQSKIDFYVIASQFSYSSISYQCGTDWRCTRCFFILMIMVELTRNQH